MTTAHVHTPDREWEPVGTTRPADRLITTIHVHDCPVHLEAVRVVERDGLLLAADPLDDETLEHAAAINGIDQFRTATIDVDGKVGDYVIVATSFGG